MERNMNPIQIGFEAKLRIEDVAAYSRNRSSTVTFKHKARTIEALNNSLRLQSDFLAENQNIYGITTGFGSSSRNRFDREKSLELQSNLVKYHGCGIGDPLSHEVSAASLLCRTHCLSLGQSAVSPELIDQLLSFANKRLFPVIPSQGSVGASGDLTPLSYLAAALQGDRKVFLKEVVTSTDEALVASGLTAYKFKEREALALMNGTSVMTAIACLAWTDAKTIANTACTLTGLLVELLGSLTAPFTAALHERKPHKGQIKAAENIMALLNEPEKRLYMNKTTKTSIGQGARSKGFQDCYSLRCAPHVIGVLYDSLDWSKTLIETELNSVNDNPVFCVEESQILHGGHFFGGHIAMACDTLKTSVANVVNLMDRHLSLILETAKHEEILPENLVARSELGETSWLHHGFKAMQISLSALAAEIQKTSLPMGIFSRPTESMNQDVVSMGTIAARDLYSINDMAMNALAIQAMSIRQAYFVKAGPNTELNNSAAGQLEKLCSAFEPVIEDRPLDHCIARMRTEFLQPHVDAN